MADFIGHLVVIRSWDPFPTSSFVDHTSRNMILPESSSMQTVLSLRMVKKCTDGYLCVRTAFLPFSHSAQGLTLPSQKGIFETRHLLRIYACTSATFTPQASPSQANRGGWVGPRWRDDVPCALPRPWTSTRAEPVYQWREHLSRDIRYSDCQISRLHGNCHRIEQERRVPQITWSRQGMVPTLYRQLSSGTNRHNIPASSLTIRRIPYTNNLRRIHPHQNTTHS